MKKIKIYIIGKIPLRIDALCESKFRKAHSEIYNQGFVVINPLVRLTNKNLTREEAKIGNFQDLLLCDAVYLLPCVSLSEKGIDIELKWALDRNLYIINGQLEVVDEFTFSD